MGFLRDDLRVPFRRGSALLRGGDYPQLPPRLSHLRPRDITVIEFDEEHRKLKDNPVGQRYRAVFGSSIDRHTDGLQGWLAAPKSPAKTKKG